MLFSGALSNRRSDHSTESDIALQQRGRIILSVMHVKWGGMRGPYLRVLYMCTLSFSFPDCSLSDGREVSGEGGGQGKEEDIFVGELTVSNL